MTADPDVRDDYVPFVDLIAQHREVAEDVARGFERVHAIDASGIEYEGDDELGMSGYAQCCWTNGFIPVTVTR